jgi:hypothetical protein
MFKAQAAMEYLTTYGWAILIIAVVIVGLFELGLFNGSNYGSRAQAGGCQVYRAYGPGTIQQINLEGVCNTEIPKSVSYFDGVNGNINIPTSQSLYNPGQLTVGMWIDTNASAGALQDVLTKTNSGGSSGFLFPITTNGWNNIQFEIRTGSTQTYSVSYPGTDKWNYVVATYNGFAMSIYINGALAGSQVASGNIVIDSSNITVGSLRKTGNWYSGEVSNIQIYNKSLNSNQISQLYTEGIGGPPELLQNLVGWWPLNGDVVDYSGNQQNGVSNSIYFSEAWDKNYVTP